MAKPAIIASLIVASLLLTACVTNPTVKLGKTAKPEQISSLRGYKNMQVVQRGETMRILIATDSCFDLYTPTILSGCRSKLNAIVNVVQQYGAVPITIIGYTDAVPGTRESIILSRRQAEAIRTYFWVHGIPFQNMRAIAGDGHDPIATNLNTDGSFYNRRVEISWRRGQKVLVMQPVQAQVRYVKSCVSEDGPCVVSG